MTRKPYLDSVEAVKALSQKLSTSVAVTRLDVPDQEPESWALAYTLSELERSFDRICNQLLGDLIDAPDQGRIVDTLHSIGEELRHIVWHIDDSKYYRYLRTQDPAT